MTTGNGNHECKKCGNCCFLIPVINLSGKNFVPISYIMPSVQEADKPFFQMFVCESFDPVTRQCSDYENRPKSCRKFFCKGNPRAMSLEIEGKPSDE